MNLVARLVDHVRDVAAAAHWWEIILKTYAVVYVLQGTFMFLNGTGIMFTRTFNSIYLCMYIRM